MKIRFLLHKWLLTTKIHGKIRHPKYYNVTVYESMRFVKHSRGAFLLCSQPTKQQYSPGKRTEIIQIFTLFQSTMHAVLTQEQTLKSRSHEGTYKSNCISPKGCHYNSVKQALSRRNEQAEGDLATGENSAGRKGSDNNRSNWHVQPSNWTVILRFLRRKVTVRIKS